MKYRAPATVLYRGAYVEDPTVMDLLRKAIPDLGLYDEIDLDTGEAQPSGTRDHKALPAVTLAIPFVVLKEVEASPTLLTSWREVVTVPIQTILRRLRAAGIITLTEASQISAGTWPEAYMTAFTEISPLGMENFIINWPRESTISYNSLFVLALVEVHQLTAEDVDNLFDLTVDIVPTVVETVVASTPVT